MAAVRPVAAGTRGRHRVSPAAPALDRAWVSRARADHDNGGPPVRPARARRPLFSLAAWRPAALLTAVSVGAAGFALIMPGEPGAASGAADASAVSVAEALELSTAEAIPDVAEELSQLAASRAQRESAAQAAQVAADQAAALAAAQAAEQAAAAAEEEAAAQAQAEAASRPAPGATAVMPIQGARLTSPFGARWGTLHAGVDLAAPMLTPEYAAMNGVVLQAGPASGFGNVVYIQHDNGDVTVYGHMEEVLVTAGQVVQAGDTIALVGNRGQSTGPHLHFEVRLGGLDGPQVDPLPYLAERGVAV